MINSPFKWVGGKSRLRKSIIPLIPPHQCYVEPFGGAAWVLFGKVPSPIEVLNDIDEELINFFRVVRRQPEALVKSFDLELVFRSEFRRLAAVDPHNLSEVERAHRFYYLIMAGWGGEARYPRFQTSAADGGHGNRLIGAMKTLHQRIEPVHHRLKTVIIENLDWQECIDRYDRPTSFLYLDPPYPGNSANYRHNMRDETEHSAIAARLHRAQGKWMLSSYDTDAVRANFRGYNIVPIRSASGMRAAESAIKANGVQRTVNREILVLNYDLPPADDAVDAADAYAAKSEQAQMFDRAAGYRTTP